MTVMTRAEAKASRDWDVVTDLAETDGRSGAEVTMEDALCEIEHGEELTVDDVAEQAEDYVHDTIMGSPIPRELSSMQEEMAEEEARIAYATVHEEFPEWLEEAGMAEHTEA